MNVNSRPFGKSILSSLVLVGLLAGVFASADTIHSDYAPINAGYFIEKEILDDSFFLYEITGFVFRPLKNRTPFKLASNLKNSFSPLLLPLETYITEQKKGAMIECEENPTPGCAGSFDSLNGISEAELALEISKSSYCFGTDPFIITSKIRQESRFDMASVSATGAIGLTQLTTPGLKEILDQMGNRGERYAFIENREYIVAAIECYLGQSSPGTILNLPKISTFETKGGGREYTIETIRNLKKWILPSRQHSKITNKKVYIQRQIFLGQALLKIYLAYSKRLLPKQTTAKHYDSALRMFNGDNIRVKYAKDVIRYSKPGYGL
ncbi:MAG: hypothetical protein JNL11_13675 [Bdellovibrionaceae bacterium]|nr:hypothetical protein [Pseudobdellovibrionaceae bacterium]